MLSLNSVLLMCYLAAPDQLLATLQGITLSNRCSSLRYSIRRSSRTLQFKTESLSVVKHSVGLEQTTILVLVLPQYPNGLLSSFLNLMALFLILSIFWETFKIFNGSSLCCLFHLQLQLTVNIMSLERL